MADSKITALDNLTAANPATDMLPIVDVSDTTMAASGTTKRISINNILACSPSATLASATITGAATVGTTLGVTGVSTFAAGTAALPALTTTGDTNTGIYYPAADTFAVTTGGTERYRVDSAGNVGIGIAPKTWVTNRGGIEVAGKAAAFLALNGTGNVSEMFFNSYYDSTGPAYKYAYDGLGGRHEFGSAGWSWLIAPTNSSGAGATASTWTQAMTLDASGRLILLASTTTPATLATNGELTFTATSNTNLRFSYRGSDGTTRVANITLA